MMTAKLNVIKFMPTQQIFHIIVENHINAKAYVIFVIRNVQRIYLIDMMSISVKKMMVAKRNVYFVIRNAIQRIMIMTMKLNKFKQNRQINRQVKNILSIESFIFVVKSTNVEIYVMMMEFAHINTRTLKKNGSKKITYKGSTYIHSKFR